MTVDKMKDAIAACENAMKVSAAMRPSERPALVRNGCTCPVCRPKGRR